MKPTLGLVLTLLLVASTGEAGSKSAAGSTKQSVGHTSAVIVPGVETPWPGKIFVSHDDWIFSDYGLTVAPDGHQLALNIAAWFAGGRPGKFVAYSSYFPLTGDELAKTMRSAGHSWTVTTTLDFSLSSLREYDGIFFAGNPADNAALIDYVRAGGNVFIEGGTGVGGAVDEANRWNTLLNAFGLGFEGYYDPIGGTTAVATSSSLFQNVAALYQLNGNPVVQLGSGNHAQILVTNGDEGLFATYVTSVIPVSVEVCPTRLPLNGKGTLAAAIAGSANFNVRKIDPASVRVVGATPRGATYDYRTANTTSAVRLGKTTVSACLGGRGDGYLDLVLIMDAGDLVKAITAKLGRTLLEEETIALTLTGQLKPEFGGTPIVGESLVITKR